MRDIVRFWLPLGLLFGCGGGGGASGPGSDAGIDAGGDDEGPHGNHIENPEIVPGGGLGSGAIDGELNVFVIDGVTEEPIEGAEVRVGDASDTSPLEDVTDADGFVVFRGEGLEGAQVITASAEAHAPTTWIGANGAVVTIPLEPTTTPTPPTASVSGTIEAANLEIGHYMTAVVTYSLAENEDEPIPSGVTVCQDLVGNCAWTLTTRTGPLAAYALLYDVNPNGTPDPSDDTFAFHGYALKTGLDLEADEVLADQELAIFAGADLVTTEIAYGTLPTGLTDVQRFARLELGDEGNVTLPATPGTPTLDVPALAGVLAADSYRMIAFAQPAPDVDTPQSAILHRTTDVEGVVDIGSWLSMPYDLAADAGAYSFMPATGATIHGVEFTDSADGTRLWTVALLDGSASFELPELGTDPFPADTDMTVQAFDLPGFDPTQFALRGLIDMIERISSDRLTFTP